MKKSIFVMISTFFLITLWASANLTAGTIFDNFDDGNADGWWLSHRGNWSIENGSLRQDHGATDSGEDHVLGLVENLFISDQLIETQVSTSGYGGVAFWYQDYWNYISVVAYPFSAGLAVWEKTNGIFSSLHYPYRTRLDTWYELTVDADSATGELLIYLDDSYIFTYYASTPYRTGQSGVTSGNGGAYFDDFRLTSNDIATSVPDASIMLLLGSSLMGLLGFGRRLKKQTNRQN